MSTDALDKLIWLLVFGGMAAIGLGLSLAKAASPLGYTLVSAGALAVLVGAVLIVVRSRLKPPPAGSQQEEVK